MRTSNTKTILRGATAAALAGAMTLGASAGAANAQGISGVTSCAATGGKQEGGALIGALIGAVAGSNLAKNERGLGTAVGAVAGAAAGSAIGCQMQHNEQRQYGYGRPATFVHQGVRFDGRVQPASFAPARETMVATAGVNLRSAPTTRSAKVGALRRGERFEALGRVRGTNWVLVGQGGVAVGYVHAGYVQPDSYRYAAYRY